MVSNKLTYVHFVVAEVQRAFSKSLFQAPCGLPAESIALISISRLPPIIASVNKTSLAIFTVGRFYVCRPEFISGSDRPGGSGGCTASRCPPFQWHLILAHEPENHDSYTDDFQAQMTFFICEASLVNECHLSVLCLLQSNKFNPINRIKNLNYPSRHTSI